MITDFIECRIMVGWPRCAHPSVHFFVSRSRSCWPPCTYPSIRGCVVCVVVVMCACSVVYVCALCVEMVVRVCWENVWCMVLRVCVWDVRFVFWCCGVFLCVVCGVCGATWHAEKKPVCRFKTPPCVPAKRAHVEHRFKTLPFMPAKRMHVFNMRAFCGTHGGVLNLHTETCWTYTRGGGRRGGFSSLSLFPSLFSLPSSFSLPSFSFSSLSLLFLISSQ